jgi:single-strand DNA-binding protein
MNIVNLVGRLAKDPVARDRSDTRITELILVTERPVIRDGKVQKDPETGYPVKDAEFHKVTVFNGMGLPLRQHKAKGDQLAVTGRIHYSRWQDAEGNGRSATRSICVISTSETSGASASKWVSARAPTTPAKTTTTSTAKPLQLPRPRSPMTTTGRPWLGPTASMPFNRS